MQLARIITKQINSHLFKGKVVVLYGARQVGKTTLTKKILEEYSGLYINCELPQYREILLNHNISLFTDLVKNKKIVALDEAQTVENIGLFLKIIHDTCPEIQIIATGSSSFDLANKINEPLTGRAIKFMLYPLAAKEIISHSSKVEFLSKLERLLIYGSYPEVYTSTIDQAKITLKSIASNYLYKDILNYEDIKKPKLLDNLLISLALQLGNEVSFNELANNLKTSSHTVEKYIDLLEKIFVIYRLNSFSRNLRKEISKSVKIYFYDLGVRNFIINNFNSLKLRSDVGALWENFVINEKIKKHHNNMEYFNKYFWRTYDQQEIDYIEEYEGKLHAFEFKWGGKSKANLPKAFEKGYSNIEFKLINKDNILEELGL